MPAAVLLFFPLLSCTFSIFNPNYLKLTFMGLKEHLYKCDTANVIWWNHVLSIQFFPGVIQQSKHLIWLESSQCESPWELYKETVVKPQAVPLPDLNVLFKALHCCTRAVNTLHCATHLFPFILLPPLSIHYELMCWSKHCVSCLWALLYIEKACFLLPNTD